MGCRVHLAQKDEGVRLDGHVDGVQRLKMVFLAWGQGVRVKGPGSGEGG